MVADEVCLLSLIPPEDSFKGELDHIAGLQCHAKMSQKSDSHGCEALPSTINWYCLG